jgi:mono/diheme cytochrome c family protein
MHACDMRHTRNDGVGRSTRASAIGRGFAVLAWMMASVVANAASDLTVVIAGRATTYTADALLGNPAVSTITVPGDVAYKQTTSYRALPLATLLQGLGPQDSVRFVASDGFAATLPAAPLLATAEDGARAYLAVEPPGTPWAPLKAGSPATAGTFFLVWLRPERAKITPEQWPYQIAKIEDVAPIATRFPALLPAANVAATGPIQRGLGVFTTNCSVCHTLNLAGDAQVGPDLNVPFSPTEYLREEALRRLIRNPQSLRHWQQAKMPAFDTRVMSARQLDDLLAYMRHMAKRKVDVPPAK